MKEEVKNSKNTAMKTDKPSPAIKWLEKKGYFSKDKTILDYGAGHGRNVKYLRDLGYNIIGYDPYHINDLVQNVLPVGKFDVVFTSFVLNVVDSHVSNNIEFITKNLGEKVFHIVRNKDVIQLAKKYGEDPHKGFYTTRGFQRLVSNINNCVLLEEKSGYKIYTN